MGAMRSKDGFLRTDQSAALYEIVTLKISTEHAQTLPYGSTPLFMLFGYLHSAKPLVCEANQSVSARFYETGLNGF